MPAGEVGDGPVPAERAQPFQDSWKSTPLFFLLQWHLKRLVTSCFSHASGRHRRDWRWACPCIDGTRGRLRACGLRNRGPGTGLRRTCSAKKLLCALHCTKPQLCARNIEPFCTPVGVSPVLPVNIWVPSGVDLGVVPDTVLPLMVDLSGAVGPDLDGVLAVPVVWVIVVPVVPEKHSQRLKTTEEMHPF